MRWNYTIIVKPQSGSKNNNENQGNYRPILVYIRKVSLNAIFDYVPKYEKEAKTNDKGATIIPIAYHTLALPKTVISSEGNKYREEMFVGLLSPGFCQRKLRVAYFA